jgi:dipeptide transport system permease protein
MTDIAAKPVTDTRKTGRLALLSEFWAYFSENKGAVPASSFSFS